MKAFKWLAAGAMALALCGCTSPAEDETVKEDDALVSVEDSSALKEESAEASAADENGGEDVDYGTPENGDADTSIVPTSAEEVMETEDQTENS